MNKFLKVADQGCAVVLLVDGTTSFILLIAAIGLCRSCMGLDEIDIDNSYMVKRYQFDRRFVEDPPGMGMNYCGTPPIMSQKNATKRFSHDNLFGTHTNGSKPRQATILTTG